MKASRIVYTREECPFVVCDDPAACVAADRCRHRPPAPPAPKPRETDD